MKERVIEPIQNSDNYLNELKKSFVDKADFMQFLDPQVKVIVDFGCADASFIQFVKAAFPEYQYYGIENNPEFLEKAKAKIGEDHVFTTLQEFYEETEVKPEETHLNMSSVIHEIFAYEAKPKRFMCNIPRLYDFHSISIRDMMFFEKCYHIDLSDITRMSNYNRSDSINADGVYKFVDSCWKRDFNDVIRKVLQQTLTDKSLNDKMYEFLRCNNCEFKEPEIVMEFLLKYFYDDNWKREVRENYFFHDKWRLIDVFTSYDYALTTMEEFTPQFLPIRWAKDFGLTQGDIICLKKLSTHCKMFFRKKTEEELKVTISAYDIASITFNPTRPWEVDPSKYSGRCDECDESIPMEDDGRHDQEGWFRRSGSHSRDRDRDNSVDTDGAGASDLTHNEAAAEDIRRQLDHLSMTIAQMTQRGDVIDEAYLTSDRYRFAMEQELARLDHERRTGDRSMRGMLMPAEPMPDQVEAVPARPARFG